MTRAAQLKQARKELEALPHAKELRAFFATPAGNAASRELFRRFVLGPIAGGCEFELGRRLGSRDVALWLLGYGVGMDDLLSNERKETNRDPNAAPNPA